MSALEGFRTIWSHASATFGADIPSGAAGFDSGGRLQGLQETVASARPGEEWTGSAADSYADATTRQEGTLAGLGNLERRLAVEVDRSAAVVAAGRRELETVRRFVDDAAARVPDTAAGERLLYPAISKGSSDIQDIIVRSHGDLNAIAARIRVIGGEYRALLDGA